jgi:hypothetical protein
MLEKNNINFTPKVFKGHNKLHKSRMYKFQQMFTAFVTFIYLSFFIKVECTTSIYYNYLRKMLNNVSDAIIKHINIEIFILKLVHLIY